MDGPQIYTYEDKTGKSGREIRPVCPAPIGDELTVKAQEIAIRVFNALGLYDCARIDMRLDDDGEFFVLEANSLPSLGEHGSYLVGADAIGLDFAGFVNRPVDVASARYFGTPQPTALDVDGVDARAHALSYVTQRRDRLEKRLREWVEVSSRTNDPMGVEQAVQKARNVLEKVGMKPVPELTDGPEVWTWETATGLEGGTLLVGHLDTPVDVDMAAQAFRRDPEWLYGEGIGTSRAPLVMVEYAFRALRSLRKLRRVPLGVLLYTDEGRDAVHSTALIRAAAAKAKSVIVLRPATTGGALITNRRGARRYVLKVEGQPLRPGQVTKKLPVLRWTWDKLDQMAQLSSMKKRLSLATIDLKPERHSMMVPHRVTATILVTYFSEDDAEKTEKRMREILGKKAPKWQLTLVSDRPPMKERAASLRLAKSIEDIAKEFSLPIARESSTWSSVAGLVPQKTACVCGAGPLCRDRGTPSEAVQRVSLIQRTILMAEYLLSQLPAK